MSVSAIYQSGSNYGESVTNDFSLSSVACQTGDLIVFSVSFRDTPGTNDINVPTWNGQTFTSYSSNTQPYHITKTFVLVAASNTTANIVCTTTLSAYFLGSSSVRVYRGVTSYEAVQYQVELDSGGSWLEPSIIVSSAMQTGDLVESFLSSSGWTAGFGTPATTFSPGGSETLYNSVLHSESGVGDIKVSYLSSTGTPTISWDASDSDQPVYYHQLLLMRGTVANAITDINGDEVVRVGSTGNTIETTGLGDLIGLTIGGKEMDSVSTASGSGTFDAPIFVDEEIYSLMGSVTATGDDGSDTADITVNLLPMAGFDYVSLSGVLNTSDTGVLYNFSPEAVEDDQIVFDESKGSVDSQGNFTGDYDGEQTMYHIESATGIVRSYLVITGEGGVIFSGKSITGSKIIGEMIFGEKISGRNL